MFRIAIQPDPYNETEDRPQSKSSSPLWASILSEAGCDVVWVDVYRNDILEQVAGCHGFMWRWVHFGKMHRVARRLIPALERYTNIVLYPDDSTCWHYDDKISQLYALRATGIPMPDSWVWYRRADALEWARLANYPVVLKLFSGASSENVCLVNSYSAAEHWINNLFGQGVTSTNSPPSKHTKDAFFGRIKDASQLVLSGKAPGVARHTKKRDIHRGYAYFQEYLAGNDYDTRVMVIGDRAFAYRRMNRDNDFRASGSGKVLVGRDYVSESCVRLAYRTAYLLGMQSCAVDLLYRNGLPVVSEVSYTSKSTTINSCPGHWQLSGTSDEGRLSWIEGEMWPEEAQVEDYLGRLRKKFVSGV